MKREYQQECLTRSGKARSLLSCCYLLLVCEATSTFAASASVPSNTLTRTGTNASSRQLPFCLAANRQGRRRPRSSSSNTPESSTAAAEPQLAAKGFQSKPAVETKPAGDGSVRATAATAVTSTSTTASTSERIYSLPALYDLAFGYRNFEDEVRFLVAQHQLLQNPQQQQGEGDVSDDANDGADQSPAPINVLELASGPSRHCIHAIQSNLIRSATALDASTDMIQYAKKIAKEELSDLDDNDIDQRLTFVQDDMRSFTLSSNNKINDIDSAWILLGSMQHLTTNEDVIACFRSIHSVLKPDATLIIELPHPRETFSLVECTRNGWEVPLEDDDGKQFGELEIVWGDDNDAFDPIRQVRDFTVSMELKGVPEEEQQKVKEIVPMRLFTTQEIDALARLSGFRIAALHGAVADGVDINDGDQAYRLVCVLQKEG